MIEREFAQQVDHHHHHHQIRRIAVKAAHDPGMEPVIPGQMFDRLIGPLDAGVEEDEEVDPADRNDPEEEEPERAELRERI